MPSAWFEAIASIDNSECTSDYLSRQVLNRDVFQLELQSPHRVTGLKEVQTQQAMGSDEYPVAVGAILDSANLLRGPCESCRLKHVWERDFLSTTKPPHYPSQHRKECHLPLPIIHHWSLLQTDFHLKGTHFPPYLRKYWRCSNCDVLLPMGSHPFLLWRKHSPWIPQSGNVVTLHDVKFILFSFD